MQVERWGWRVVGPDSVEKSVYVGLEEGVQLSAESAKKQGAKRLLASPYATTAYVWKIGERGQWIQDEPVFVGFEDTLGEVKWS